MRKYVTSSTRRTASLAVAAAATLAASQALANTNIIQNGGFEAADPAGGSSVAQFWNQTSPTITRDTTNPHTGTAEEYLNNTAAPSADFLFQDTPVGSVTAGSTYTLDFFYAGITPNGGELQSRVVYFSQASGPTAFEPFNYNYPTSTTQYTEATYAIPAAPAGTSYAELQFFAATGADVGSIAQIYLDDVSLSTSGGSSGGGGASVWNNPNGDDWNTASNWTNGVPNGTDAEADLFGAISSNQTITNNAAVTLGTLNFNNTNTYTISGSGSLTMQTSSGPAAIIVQAGTQNINQSLTLARNTNLNVSSGATLQLTGPVVINSGVAVAPTGAGMVNYESTIAVGSNGSLTFGNSTFPQALTLAANASATVSASPATSRKLLQVNSLSLAPTGVLDLSNNDLVVHGGDLATINGQVQTGYNNGTWTGVGIKSSSAAADTTHLTALGVIPNLNSIGGALYGSGTTLGLFDGTSPAAGDVLVKYTYYGDTNLDGKVDGSDYSNLDNGYLLHLTGWANGDFNYDGVINGSDYTLMDNAFNTQGQQIASASALLATSTAQIAGTAGGASVPEPATLSLLSAGTLALLRRRPRRTDR